MKKLISLLLALCLLAAALPCMAQDAQAEQGGRKVVYLTFDDGPKADTPELLALLEELDVPATFFFVGLAVRAFPEHAKLVLDAGHAVGCHAMVHSPSMLKEGDYIGRDIDRFMREMREKVDPDFATDIYRFPGGSPSYKKKLKRIVLGKGLAYMDWNSLSGDTHQGVKAEDIYENAIKSGKDADVIIVLMHEAKAKTRAMLPDLVAYYRERGYEFRMLSASEEEREILERCPAKIVFPGDEELGREL